MEANRIFDNRKKNIYSFTIKADTKQAISQINKLTKSVNKLTTACKPKWYQFWRLFAPIIININLDSVIGYEKHSTTSD
jgi:hypothetical protein